MENLLKEYAKLIDEDKLASEGFWELEKHIKRDKKKNGAIVVNTSRSKSL